MSGRVFKFAVFSGGTVSFDLDTCARCPSKVCVTACNAPNLACVLELKEGLPALRITPEQTTKGGCIECLACELACAESGIGGISFTLPMPELDEYVRELEAADMLPGYRLS